MISYVAVPVRPILCLVSLIIFAVQMYFALQRFNEMPTMYEQDSTNVLDLKKMPIVNICPFYNYDYNMSNKFGFLGKTEFFGGEGLGKNYLSWTGSSGKTFEEVRDILWAEMKETLGNVTVLDHTLKPLKDQPKNYIVIPQGLCKSLTTYEIDSKSGALSIDVSHGEVSVFITDPAKDIWFKADVNSLYGHAMTLKVDKSLAQHKYYKVTIKETHMRDGVDGCKTYELGMNSSGSYMDCVNRELTTRWRQAYGCVPPWMTWEQGCNTTLIRKPEHQALLDEAVKYYVDSINGYTPVFKNCPVPCLKTRVSVKYYGHYLRPFWNKSRLSISFMERVPQQFMKSAYNEVDLLIEAGSSLGLWLGLSVIGLYDLLIMGLRKVKMMIETPKF